MRRLDLFSADDWYQALERRSAHERKYGRPLHGVIGASKTLPNGADWYECLVDSAMTPGLRHRVTIAGTGAGVTFACDCLGHQHGRLCWHAAVALHELELWSLVAGSPRPEALRLL